MWFYKNADGAIVVVGDELAELPDGWKPSTAAAFEAQEAKLAKAGEAVAKIGARDAEKALAKRAAARRVIADAIGVEPEILDTAFGA